jgi:protein-disulfide isomerase
MKKNEGGGDLRRFYVVLAVVAVVGIGAVGYSVGSRAFGGGADAPVTLDGIDDLRRLTELAVPVVDGDPAAPVTIMVFGDYLCGHCATFSLRERPRLLAEYVQTGKARLVYYDFVLNPQPEFGTFLAARAARCAGDQGHFWEFHDQLYLNQLSWGMESGKAAIFQRYAEGMGMDGAEFRSCLNSDRHAVEVTANRELAISLGITGTPAILVGTGQGMTRRVRDYFFQSVQEAVESLLEAQG